jgi:hypothetical protein
MDEEKGRDLAFVTAALEAAGIHPSHEELAVLARRFPGMRRQVERFYAVDTGDAAPVVRLRVGE